MQGAGFFYNIFIYRHWVVLMGFGRHLADNLYEMDGQKAKRGSIYMNGEGRICLCRYLYLVCLGRWVVLFFLVTWIGYEGERHQFEEVGSKKRTRTYVRTYLPTYLPTYLQYQPPLLLFSILRPLNNASRIGWMYLSLPLFPCPILTPRLRTPCRKYL